MNFIDKFVFLMKDHLLKPAVIVAGVLILAWIGLYIYSRKAGKTTFSMWLQKLSPLVWLFLILALTIFNREAAAQGQLYLLPNYLFASGSKTRLLFAFFDILYYIPYGMLIKWCNPKFKAYHAILIVVGTALLVEILQYLLARGVGSTEQWLMDCIGGLIGIALCISIQKKKSGKKTN